MQSDLTAKRLDFVGGVRVGLKEVEHWDATFDAAAMDALSLGESSLDCDLLRFNVQPVPGGRVNTAADSGVPWEIQARGGVFFRTRSDRGLLEATASSANYASSKDLFTVEGAPNQPAVFRKTMPDGSRGPEGQVRTMSIRPKTMKIENAVLERLNMAAPNTAVVPGEPAKR